MYCEKNPSRKHREKLTQINSQLKPIECLDGIECDIELDDDFQKDVEHDDNDEWDMLQDDEGEVMNTETIGNEENETVESEKTEPRENKKEKASVGRKNEEPKISKKKKEDQVEINRKWRKREGKTTLPEYNEETGPVPRIFETCQTFSETY
ncbi:hypothetical protein JTB14_033547 [Gonioctena quinquepunctata]|nr:hypothetical protein JTB14_033547 [Gonioctena quinquepunctata]